MATIYTNASGYSWAESKDTTGWSTEAAENERLETQTLQAMADANNRRHELDRAKSLSEKQEAEYGSSANEDTTEIPDAKNEALNEPSKSPDTDQPRPQKNNLPDMSSDAIINTGAFELQNINGKPLSLFLPGQYIDIPDIKNFSDHFDSKTSRGFGGNSAIVVKTYSKNLQSTTQVNQILGRKKVSTNTVKSIDPSKVSRTPQRIVNI